MRLKICLIVLPAALLLFTPGASAQTKDPNDSGQKVETKNRLRLGGFHAGFGYSNFSRHYPLYGHFPYAFSPLYPYGVPYFYPFLAHSPRRAAGRVKLKNLTQDAAVFINGGFAGIGKDLDSFYLEPGSYELSVRRDGYEPVERKLYVLTDKSIEVDLQWKKGGTP